MADIKFYNGTMSSRFQLVLFASVLALFAAGIWFTYNAVHISNLNTAKAYSTVNKVPEPTK